MDTDGETLAETDTGSSTSNDATGPTSPSSTSETGPDPDPGTGTTTTASDETGSPEACESMPCPEGADCISNGDEGYLCDCTQAGSGDGCDLLPECGNRVIEQGEGCDEDVSPTCSAECTSCELPTPQALIDQELAPCFEGAQTDCRAGWAMTNGQSSVQGFRVSTAGRLENIELYISNDDPSVAMTVQVLDGGNNPNFPTGASNQELANSSIATAAANGSQTAAWVEFDFSGDEVELDPSHYYFIWQRMVEPYPADSSDRFRWNLWASPEVADPYTDGRSFFCPPIDGCASQLQHWDYAFRVELTPAPPLCGE